MIGRNSGWNVVIMNINSEQKIVGDATTVSRLQSGASTRVPILNCLLPQLPSWFKVKVKA